MPKTTLKKDLGNDTVVEQIWRDLPDKELRLNKCRRCQSVFKFMIREDSIKCGEAILRGMLDGYYFMELSSEEVDKATETGIRLEEIYQYAHCPNCVRGTPLSADDFDPLDMFEADCN